MNFGPAITTICDGTHKRPLNQRLLGSERKESRARTTFMPPNLLYSSFLISTFGRISQLPNPVYMKLIDPKSIRSQEEEIAAAVQLVGASPAARQEALYRVMLARLKLTRKLPEQSMVETNAPTSGAIYADYDYE